MKNMPDDEQKAKLLQVIRNAVLQDKELRDKYQIGDKFRFIRDRLNALLSRVEESLLSLETESQEKLQIGVDEIKVYVHLFNIQGDVMSSWQKMLNPSVFYEYSINRPIYAEKSHVSSFIRSKAKPIQHAYLTVIVKKHDIVTIGEPAKDAIGNPVIKVKEGSLLFTKLISLTHNGQEYEIDEDGGMRRIEHR